MTRILAEGDNCWQIARAHRAAFLIDAEAYFGAVREAVIAARRSIFIIGWDVHSELALVRDERDDGYPHTLRKLLDAVAAQQSKLHIYILNWDFAMIYALEREFLPGYKLQWKSHRRVHFCLDGNHPVGGSQHQKLVVIDGRVAFCGGIDLGKWRWDTRDHTLEDKRRKDPDGADYPPFHDVQMVTDGPAAAALADLAVQRWRDAGGCDPIPMLQSTTDPWPESVEPDLRDVDVGVARTLPAWGDRQAVREVEKLYMDSIAAARNFIYVENQYLSSLRIGEALEKTLAQESGPEIVVVMPRETGGWLEQHTMDVLRVRLLKALRDADRHNRLRVYCVRLARDPSQYLMVHAKVMVIDDHFVRIGSSNLSNRSMGLDSECDLAVESGSVDSAFTCFRRSLLAEHLGVPMADIARAEEQSGSLIAAIESLAKGERGLEELAAHIPESIDQWVPESRLIDPEAPVEPEQLLDYIVGDGQARHAWRHAYSIGVLLLTVLGLAAAWRWTPLSEWLSLERLNAAAQWIEQSPLTPLLAISAFVIGGLFVLPLTLMIITAVTAFGPWLGMAYALAGAELSALLSFGLGHLMGREAVSRIAGSRLNAISRVVSQRGVFTMVTLRIVPVAPFTVVNIIAGTTRIRLRDFALGTLIGLIPGIAAIAFLADSMMSVLRKQNSYSIAMVLIVMTLVVGGLYTLRHWLRRRQSDAGST